MDHSQNLHISKEMIDELVRHDIKTGVNGMADLILGDVIFGRGYQGAKDKQYGAIVLIKKLWQENHQLKYRLAQLDQSA